MRLPEWKTLRDLCFGAGGTRITGILLAAVTQRDTGIRYLIYQVWKWGERTDEYRPCVRSSVVTGRGF